MTQARPCVAVIKDSDNGDLVFGPFESLDAAGRWLMINCPGALANNNTFLHYLMKPRELSCT